MPLLEEQVATLSVPGLPGEFHVERVSLAHKISDLPTWTLSLYCDNPDLNFQQAIFRAATLTIAFGPFEALTRTMNGIITGFSLGQSRRGRTGHAAHQFYDYEIEVQPRFALLGRQFRSRIFRHVTARDIIANILQEHGVVAKWNLNSAPREREYCVQHQESDLNFVQRLLEDEGITYAFSEAEDQLLLFDHNAAAPVCAPQTNLRFHEHLEAVHAEYDQDVVTEFGFSQRLGPGRHVIADYNASQAQIRLIEEAPVDSAAHPPQLEDYRYGPGAADNGCAAFYATVRAEAARAEAMSAWGYTASRSLTVGHWFTLGEHYREDFNQRWLVTGLTLSLERGAFRCRFDALPIHVPFRPPLRTPRPRINGTQTAVVTGPEGSQVYMDDLGRCKIQFHWDREGARNETSSMWVRVANGYAGKDYGIQFIPRIGHEVLIGFVDGNPDQPYVAGRVYNDHHAVPLKPAQKTQNIIKSIKDNHLLFDDADGAELVQIRAAKNMNTEVVNDANRTVGWNDSHTIGGNQTNTIALNRFEAIGLTHTCTVGVNLSLMVGVNRMDVVGMNHSQRAGRNMKMKAGRNMSVRAGKDQVVTVGKNQTTAVGKNQSTKVAKDCTLKVGGELMQTVGDQYRLTVKDSLETRSGKEMIFEASDDLTLAGKKKGEIRVADKLTIKVGKATFVLNKNGKIQVNGSDVLFKAKKHVKVKASKIALN